MQEKKGTGLGGHAGSFVIDVLSRGVCSTDTQVETVSIQLARCDRSSADREVWGLSAWRW